MTSRTLKSEAVQDEYADLALACAEAVRALRGSPPNRAALNALLARIDALLAEAQDQLAEAVHASQLQRSAGAGVRALSAALERAGSLEQASPVQWG